MKNVADTWEVDGGIAIGSQTCVGTMCTEYPFTSGNCFDMQVSSGKYYNILNFVVENLEYLLEHNKITYPIKLLVITDRHAVIADGRIPDEWYRGLFCETCCPVYLLPVTQRLKHLRDIDRGIREEDDGFITIHVEAKQRALKGTWSIEYAPEEIIINERAVEEFTDILTKEIDKEK